MANMKRVYRMAEDLRRDVLADGRWRHSLPDWAGIGWILSPYYCRSAREILAALGPDWSRRAADVLRALRINSEWHSDRREAKDFERLRAAINT